jgi:hypothetical protein
MKNKQKELNVRMGENKSVNVTNMLEHKSNLFCKKCGHLLRKDESVQRHILSVHRELALACAKCDRKFVTVAGRVKHYQIAHHITPCLVCDEHFTSQTELLTHAKTKQDNQHKLSHKQCVSTMHKRLCKANATRCRHKCYKCCYKTLTLPLLRRHNATSHRSRKVRCPTCWKQFNKNGAIYKLHKLTVHRTRKPCRLCDKTFTSAITLSRHKAVIHKTGTEKSRHKPRHK